MKMPSLRILMVDISQKPSHFVSARSIKFDRIQDNENMWQN